MTLSLTSYEFGPEADGLDRLGGHPFPDPETGMEVFGKPLHGTSLEDESKPRGGTNLDIITCAQCAHFTRFREW